MVNGRENFSLLESYAMILVTLELAMHRVYLRILVLYMYDTHEFIMTYIYRVSDNTPSTPLHPLANLKK